MCRKNCFRRERLEEKKLTEQKYWEKIYEHDNPTVDALPPEKNTDEKKRSIKQIFKQIFKKILGKNILDKMHRYADYLQWEVLYPKYLTDKRGQSLVEIGSAPGEHLVRLQKRFGLIPYGIEYTENGVRANRQIFEKNGVPSDQVIAGDFFSSEIQSKYKEHFDIVLSRGFLEHFENPKEVIDQHLNVLKPGGLLIVMIPNFRKFNYLLMRLLNPELMAVHNLKIMEKKTFESLFPSDALEKKECKYFGTLFLGLAFVQQGSLRFFIVNQLKNIQILLNFFFRLLFGKKGFETRFFSPYLLYIGKKKVR